MWLPFLVYGGQPGLSFSNFEAVKTHRLNLHFLPQKFTNDKIEDILSPGQNKVKSASKIQSLKSLNHLYYKVRQSLLTL